MRHTVLILSTLALLSAGHAVYARGYDVTLTIAGTAEVEASMSGSKPQRSSMGTTP